MSFITSSQKTKLQEYVNYDFGHNEIQINDLFNRSPEVNKHINLLNALRTIGDNDRENWKYNGLVGKADKFLLNGNVTDPEFFHCMCGCVIKDLHEIEHKIVPGVKVIVGSRCYRKFSGILNNKEEKMKCIFCHRGKLALGRNYHKGCVPKNFRQ